MIQKVEWGGVGQQEEKNRFSWYKDEVNNPLNVSMENLGPWECLTCLCQEE